jgi:Flp pilus assembly protein TadD
MKKTLAAGLLAAMALLLTGCGGNDDAQAAQSISDSIMKEQKSSGQSSQLFSMDKKDADCIGKGLVDKIGADQLQKYGVLTKDNKTKDQVTNVKMSAGDAKSATDVLFKCTDVQGMMQKALDQSGNVPAAMKACVNKVLTEDNLHTMFEKIFAGQQDEAQKALVQPMMKCATGSQG